MEKAITAKEYAKEIGASLSYVTKTLKRTGTLPMVDSVEKYANTWRIIVSADFKKEEAKKLLKTIK